MDFTPDGYISLPDMVYDLWRNLWPDEPDEPAAGPVVGPVVVQLSIQRRADSHLKAIKDCIQAALEAGEFRAYVLEGGPKPSKVPTQFWSSSGARWTISTNKVESQGASRPEWRKWHLMPVFVTCDAYDGWRDKLLGNLRSVWIELPSAWKLVHALTGIGLDEVRARLIHKLRDGELKARGTMRTDKGPEFIDLGLEWWSGLTYRAGANMVVLRDDRADEHIDDKANPVPFRKPEERSSNQYAYEISVRRAELLSAFEITPRWPLDQSEDVFDAVAGHTAQGEKAASQAPIFQPRKPGRKRGVGGYANQDRPLVQEMHQIIAKAPDTSPHAAAMQVADRAQGGTTESKAKRLVKRYHEQNYGV